MENRYTNGVFVEGFRTLSLATVLSLLKKEDTVIIDTETTISDDMWGRELVSIQLLFGKHNVFISVKDQDLSLLMEELKTKILIGHNIKFDLNMLYTTFGFKAKDVIDTMLAERILDMGRKRGEGYYSLASSVRRRVDQYAYTDQGNLFKSTVNKSIRTTFGEELDKAKVDYALDDTEYTYKLWKKQSLELDKEDLRSIFDLEREFTLVLSDMETEGIHLDVDQWLEVYEEERKISDSMLLELRKEYDINWNSPKQVLGVFKERGVNVEYIDKRTGELKEGVNKTVLAFVTDEVVLKYLRYKEITKLANAYGVKFLRHISPKTGKIHTDFFQMVNTGRTSSSPNLQNLPSKDGRHRACFKAGEGNVFVSADYSGQEMRIAADFAEEKTLIEAIAKGKDLHLMTASLVYGEEITNKEDYRRSIAKTIGFTILYGGGPAKISKQFQMPMADAKAAVLKFKEVYPYLTSYLDKKEQDSIRQGYILTNTVSKRKIYINEYEKLQWLSDHCKRFDSLYHDIHPKILEEYKTMLSSIKREAYNYPIQSTGADIAKLAGILMKRRLSELRIIASPVILVHDEWIYKCKNEDAEVVSRLLEECMLDASKYFLKHLTAPAKAGVSSFWKK